MPIEIQLPRLGWSMEEGRFLAWLKRDGDFVKQGEPLFTLESDKAAQDVEATDDGFLAFLPDGPKPGATVKVGQVLGYLLAAGESVPRVPPNSPSNDPAAASAHRQTIAAKPPGAGAPEPAVEAPASSAAAHPASPRARRAAREHQILLSTLQPSGRGGRIRERDVLAAAAGIATPGTKQVPLTPTRRAIAARLLHSHRTTVPVTITGRVDATQIVTLRAQLKAAGAGVVPSVTDILARLAASALHQHPMLAATWTDDHLLLPDSIHIGIAVDTEAGLLVPVIRDPGAATLTQIAAQSRRLIAAARAGSIAAADLQGACFTLSNLGSLGVESFTPIINPPESAILGIGAIVREAVPLDDGTFRARDRLTLCLTFDHRVNDGAAAARFLQTLRHLIEQPLLDLL